MPLVRIDLPQSIGEEQRAAIGDVVYQTLVDVLGAHKGNKFQIITAHDRDALRIDPTYGDGDRSAAAFVIDITLNTGRTAELKQQFYKELVDRLKTQAQVRPQDVLILLIEVSPDNWSVGNGKVNS